MHDRKQSQNEIKQYKVPISKFKREFNSWFERIKVGNLKTKIITFESKENSLVESQEKLDKKFEQLLETIKSQG